MFQVRAIQNMHAASTPRVDVCSYNSEDCVVPEQCVCVHMLDILTIQRFGLRHAGQRRWPFAAPYLHKAPAAQAVVHQACDAAVTCVNTAPVPGHVYDTERGLSINYLDQTNHDQTNRARLLNIKTRSCVQGRALVKGGVAGCSVRPAHGAKAPAAPAATQQQEATGQEQQAHVPVWACCVA